MSPAVEFVIIPVKRKERVELAENGHTHADYHNEMDGKMVICGIGKIAAHKHSHTHCSDRVAFQVKLVFDFPSGY